MRVTPATQSSTSKQPTYLKSGWDDGTPTVYFDGLDDVMTGTMSFPSQATVIAVFKDAGTTITCCSGLFVTYPSYYGIGLMVTANGLQAMADCPGCPPSTQFAGEVSYVISTIVVTYTATTTTLHLNGILLSSFATFAPYLASTSFAIGSRGESAFNRYTKGLYKEVIVYGSALSDADRNSVLDEILSRVAVPMNIYVNHENAIFNLAAPVTDSGFSGFTVTIESGKLTGDELRLQAKAGYVITYTSSTGKLGVSNPTSQNSDTMTSLLNCVRFFTTSYATTARVISYSFSPSVPALTLAPAYSVSLEGTYSATFNPNGMWSYGYAPSSLPPTVFTLFNTGNNVGGGLSYWGSSTSNVLGTPRVGWKNTCLDLPAGVYTVAGVPNVYCDGSGWALLSNWNNAIGAQVTFTQVTSVSPNGNGYLSEASVRTLSLNRGTQVKLVSGGSSVTSTNALAVTALQTGGNWGNGATWTGAAGWCWQAGCGSSLMSLWPNMYHSYCNGACVHWLGNGNLMGMSWPATIPVITSQTWLYMAPVSLQPGQIFFHPGCAANEHAVIKWKSPKTSSYNFKGAFYVGDFGTVTGLIYYEGAQKFYAVVSTIDQFFDMTFEVELNKEVWIMVGAYDGCSGDETPIRLDIMEVGSTLSVYLTDTGHFYESVPAAGITWTVAKNACAARTMQGKNGYLVTLTTSAEKTFFDQIVNGVGWIGASDDVGSGASEGVWKWVTGPEAGTTFWNGAAGGSCVAGQYCNWQAGEPNNAGGEHWAVISASKGWNDSPDTWTAPGYFCEYGGLGGDVPVPFTWTASVTVAYSLTKIYFNKDMYIFKGISTPRTTDVFTGFTMTIQTGKRTGDELRLGSHVGYTIAYDSNAGVLSVASTGGTKETTTVTNLVKKASFFTTSLDSRTARTISYSYIPAHTGVDSQTIFSSTTGHFYERVPAAGITWTDAKDACAARTMQGKNGYLVTLTTSAEQTFFNSIVTVQGWLGASDDFSSGASEGVWKWVTGPEAGTTFWNGAWAAAGGSCVAGQYCGWSANEPNNSPTSGEHWAVIVPSVGWYDYPNSINLIAAYYCEYGGLVTDGTPPYTSTGSTKTGPSTRTDSQSFTESDEDSVTSTVSSDATFSGTHSHGVSDTLSPTQDVSVTLTDTGTRTASSDATLSGTLSQDVSDTFSDTYFASKTSSPTQDATLSGTPSHGVSDTLSPTQDVSGTLTDTVTRTRTASSDATLSGTLSQDVSDTLTDTYFASKTSSPTQDATLSGTPSQDVSDTLSQGAKTLPTRTDSQSFTESDEDSVTSTVSSDATLSGTSSQDTSDTLTVACEVGYITYPTCAQCTVSAHCSGHAASVTSNVGNTACTCTCSPGFTGTTCNACGVGYITYPTCVRIKTSTKSKLPPPKPVPQRKTRTPSVTRSDYVGSVEDTPTFKLSKTKPEKKRTASTRTPSDPAASRDSSATLKRSNSPSKSSSDPMTAEKMLVSVSSTIEQVVNRTETHVSPIPTPIEELTPAEKAVATSVSVVTAVAAMGSPAAAALDSLQTTVLFSQMSCMQPKVRDMASTNEWVLSPLAAWSPAIVAHREANMILWNMVLLGVIWGAHFTVSRVSYFQKSPWLMYPYLSLTLTTFLYQGSTFAAYRIFFRGEAVYIPLAVATLGMSIGLPIWIWRCLQSMTLLKWLPTHMSLVFVPLGVWEPAELVSTHGLIFDEYNDKERPFKIVVLAFGHVIALTTSALPTSSIGCHVQVGACVVLTVSMGFIYAFVRPLRWPILNWSRCATLLLQAIQLLISFSEVQGTPGQLVTTLITISCLVESLLGAACTMRGWVLYAVLHPSVSKLDDGDIPLIAGTVNTGEVCEKEMVSMMRPPPPKLGLLDDEPINTYAPPMRPPLRPPAPTFELLGDDDEPASPNAPPARSMHHALSMALARPALPPRKSRAETTKQKGPGRMQSSIGNNEAAKKEREALL